MLTASLSGLEPREKPAAGSITRIVQYVGGAFGTGLLATILARQLALHGTSVAGASAAFSATFWWSIAFTAVGVIPAFFLPGRGAVSTATAPGAGRVT
jgi:hypothetical protein